MCQYLLQDPCTHLEAVAVLVIYMAGIATEFCLTTNLQSDVKRWASVFSNTRTAFLVYAFNMNPELGFVGHNPRPEILHLVV